MSGTTDRLPGRPALSDPSDWLEAGFPELDAIPARHGIHVEERLVDDRFELQAELPGIDAEEIEIIVAEGCLTLRAERSGETTDQGVTVFHFGHSTPLPPGAMSDEATAECEHGVLTVRMPVRQATTGIRTIPVRRPLSVDSR
ncbi:MULTISPECIES: Hsp20/alpha crystallin family protein [unclassified Streptomyces]|uniref:Hsp20/alpha crystallin family protein n=1 Tax=unclassified Streptomyces TaxID=2593676 RepID=UPI00093C39BB|nr:Hsp20/alpha crystallin family protein [Streptomyces sp. TSRI0107]OKJ72614.1 crystallin [Streptomyces sp. TSRI0107]